MEWFEKMIDKVARIVGGRPSRECEEWLHTRMALNVLSSDLRPQIRQWDTEALLTLRDSTTLKTTIGHTDWFNHESKDILGFPLNDQAKESTVEDLANLYHDLETKIIAAKERAEASGKPLLIMVGDRHYRRNALLCEYLIIDIAAKQGITTFVDEMSPTYYAHWKSTREAGLEAVEDPEYGNCIYYYLLESFKQFVDYRPIDLKWDDKESSMQERDKAMRQEISKVTNHALGVWGTHHLDGLQEGDLREQFEVIAFDVSNHLYVLNKTGQQLHPDPINYYQNRHPETGWIETVIIPGRGVGLAYDALFLAQEVIAEIEREKAGIPKDGFAADVSQGQESGRAIP